MNPDMALKLWPVDGLARALAAERANDPEFGRPNPKLARAEAIRALERQPILPRAVRVLGFLADQPGNSGRARPLMNLAARLTRRDIHTELWLINDLSAQGKTAATLAHYDIALRTGGLSNAVLFPILSSAMNDAELVGPISDLLAKRPPWINEFLAMVITSAQVPANFADLARTIAARGVPVDKRISAMIVDRYARDGRYDAAWRYFGTLVGPEQRSASVRDPKFIATAAGFEPFNWHVASLGDMNASTGEATPGLVIEGTSVDAAVAWQLLHLAPGNFVARVLAEVRGPSGSQVALTLTCATSPEREIGKIALTPGKPAVGRASYSFTLPPGCPFQWLRVAARSGMDQPMTAQIAELNISAAGSRQ